jgi:hypothetical protein
LEAELHFATWALAEASVADIHLLLILDYQRNHFGFAVSALVVEMPLFF